MKNIFIIIIVIGFSTTLYSKTKITQNTTPIANLNDVISQFDEIMDKNGIPIANAFVMSNFGGYSLGTAALGKFPSFYIGLSLTGGLANMRALDTTKSVPQGTVPVVGVNPVVFLGLGLTERIDIQAKIMLFSTGFIDVPLSFEGMSLDKLNVYSLGGKLRYNIVKKYPILPGIFTFGGVTLSLGGDFMYGIISSSGTYIYPLLQLTLPGPVTVDTNFDINYNLDVSWYIISINPQAVVYCNLFWIFNFYTGFGLPINFGSVSADLKANGNVLRQDTSANIGSLTIESSNDFVPHYVMPIYIFGIDLEILSFHISFETILKIIYCKSIKEDTSYFNYCLILYIYLNK